MCESNRWSGRPSGKIYFGARSSRRLDCPSMGASRAMIGRRNSVGSADTMGIFKIHVTCPRGAAKRAKEVAHAGLQRSAQCRRRSRRGLLSTWRSKWSCYALVEGRQEPLHIPFDNESAGQKKESGAESSAIDLDKRGTSP